MDEIAYMLEYIQEHTGNVCSDYENCEHVECNVQYHMWAYADRIRKSLHMEPPKVIDISSRLRGVMQEDGGAI